jgi:hypothetical protein
VDLNLLCGVDLAKFTLDKLIKTYQLGNYGTSIDCIIRRKGEPGPMSNRDYEKNLQDRSFVCRSRKRY